MIEYGKTKTSPTLIAIMLIGNTNITVLVNHLPTRVLSKCLKLLPEKDIIQCLARHIGC